MELIMKNLSRPKTSVCFDAKTAVGTEKQIEFWEKGFWMKFVLQRYVTIIAAWRPENSELYQ